MARKRSRRVLDQNHRIKYLFIRELRSLIFYCRQDTQRWRRIQKFGRRVRKLPIWFPA